MDTCPRVLVLTLHSGEQEFAACVAALRRQTFTGWEHRIFSGLPNVEAHHALYRTIMENTAHYDLFLKLDADMVLAGDDVLARWVAFFAEDKGLDHLITEVQDFMTRHPMEGIHMFSNRVRWHLTEERLFIDPDPQRPGTQQKRLGLSRPEVFHMPDPSPLQAFHFGVHRALKAVQPGTPLHTKQPAPALRQWRKLCQLWQHYAETRDTRLALALLGAQMVFSRKIPAEAVNYNSPLLAAALKELSALPNARLHRCIAWWWRYPATRTARWILSIGPGMLAKGLAEKYFITRTVS